MNALSSKERVRIALHHQEPDKVPLQCDFVPEVAEHLAEHFGLSQGGAEAYAHGVSELPLKLQHDLLVSWHGIATSYYGPPDPSYTCEWGVTWRWVGYKGGRYTEIATHPLAHDDALASYQPPDATDDSRYDSTRALVDAFGDTHWIVGGIPCTILEASWYLRGLERFMMDLVQNKDFAHTLCDRILEFYRPAGLKLIECGVDMLWLGDDIGCQRGMAISPATWREFFKPRMQSLIADFKSANPDIIIAYHTDGNVVEALPELIEIGVDVLNAVQPKCMDVAMLKREFGDRLSFWGTMDIQETMPYGTPADVEAEVRDRIRVLGPGGGFILAPTHNIQPDVPLENILAYYRAAERYRSYPVA